MMASFTRKNQRPKQMGPSSNQNRRRADQLKHEVTRNYRSAEQADY